MSAFWPPVELPGLYVDLGVWNPKTAKWARFPAADYRCGLCGRVESSSGDGVRAFVATIRKVHRAACPVLKKGGTAA